MISDLPVSSAAVASGCDSEVVMASSEAKEEEERKERERQRKGEI